MTAVRAQTMHALPKYVFLQQPHVMTEMPAPLMVAIHQPDAPIQPLLAMMEAPALPMDATHQPAALPHRSRAMTETLALPMDVIP